MMPQVAGYCDMLFAKLDRDGDGHMTVHEYGEIFSVEMARKSVNSRRQKIDVCVPTPDSEPALNLRQLHAPSDHRKITAIAPRVYSRGPCPLLCWNCHCHAHGALSASCGRHVCRPVWGEAREGERRVAGVWRAWLKNPAMESFVR